MEREIAILMADLTGYTAMTDVHGGASAAKLVNKYMEIVEAARHGTTQVMQRIGDQVVMIAGDSGDLLETSSRSRRCYLSLLQRVLQVAVPREPSGICG